MKTQQVLAAVLAAGACWWSATTAMAAPEDSFKDVPKDNWAYGAVQQLMLSGFIMACIGGNPSMALDGFAKGLCNMSLTPVICTIMGFSAILEYTGCSKHLVVVITRILRHCKFIAIPAAVILIFLLNTALVSASGLAAAVGAILIPALMRLGMAPAMAGAVILFGTWGSSISPANVFVIQVADIAGTNIMEILAKFALPCFLIAVVTAFLLYGIAVVRKEGPGSVALQTAGGGTVSAAGQADEDADFRVNPLKAFLPVLPLVILVLASPVVAVLPDITITNAMLLGTVVCYAVTRPALKPFAKEFFKGMGAGFVNIVILIAAANMFIQGMNCIGLIKELIALMAGSAAIAKISAVFGPFLVAAVSGSGNAAVIAFNGAVTPYAPSFGLDTGMMGACVSSAGMIGRTMSPVAGVTIICAELAGVSPMELVKRTAIPCIVAGILEIVLIL